MDFIRSGPSRMKNSSCGVPEVQGSSRHHEFRARAAGLAVVLGIWTGLFRPARARPEIGAQSTARYEIIWAGLARPEGGFGPGPNFRPVGPRHGPHRWAGLGPARPN
jgi:hypothetical protein